MRLRGRPSVARAVTVMVAGVLLFPSLVAGAAAHAQSPACLHGESSVSAVFVDGHWQVSPPARTGC